MYHTIACILLYNNNNYKVIHDIIFIHNKFCGDFKMGYNNIIISNRYNNNNNDNNIIIVKIIE